MSEPTKITIFDNGPLLVSGAVVITDGAGQAYPAKEQVALCRCGASTTKPFCNGAHTNIGFAAAERASS